MKIQLPRQTALLSIAAALSGALILAACGGGGSSPAATPPALTPITGPVPGIVEGTIVGAASGTINGVSVGLVNGTVTGTLTQVVGTGTVANAVVNTPVNSTSTVTVAGTVTGNVTGTVTGVVTGTAIGVVTAPAVSAAPADAIAKGFLQQFDAHHASFKNTGATYYAFDDACLLDDGYTKAYNVAQFDGTPATDAQGRFGFRVGSVRAATPVTVLADRSSTNADGTARRELDIEYSASFTDGSRNRTATATIISGSSSGSRNADGSACSTSENKLQWRFYGNRKVVDFNLTAWNELQERAQLATGLDSAVPTYFNNYINFTLRDPSNIATHYTIEGPAFKDNAGNPISLLAISPRVLRSDPLFAGKSGNVTDWRDIDSFRYCNASSATGNFAFGGGIIANAATVDCKTNGANTSSSIGTFNNANASAADTGFAALGFALGQAYTVKVYNNTSWQTVNGSAATTPIATLTQTLNNLPYSAQTMLAGNKYPDVTNLTLTSVVGVTQTQVSLAKLFRDKQAFTGNVAWNAPTGALPDGNNAGWSALYFFQQGPTTAATAGSNFPRSRNLNLLYPGIGSTSYSFSQAAPPSLLANPTFASFNLEYSSRNGNVTNFIFSLN